MQADITEFTLWFRAPGTRRWTPVAIGQSYSACLDQMDPNTRDGGDWLVTPKDENPNTPMPSASGPNPTGPRLLGPFRGRSRLLTPQGIDGR